jgi:uncharacterized protein
MTPQERELIADLFDRLSTLEDKPRDADAERAIADGMSRAPHAVYALVQTVLVQDEALKRANARIQELEGSGEAPPREGGSFLDSMRGALFGRDEAARGSVPSVRASNANEPPTSYGSAPYGPGGPGYGPGPYASGPYAPGFGGGSFLGNAAATAAGVIGGSLMLDGIRSMFGHHSFAGAYEPAGGRSPWDSSAGSAANSDLARQAGIDDIAGHRGGDADRHSAGLFDTADNDTDDSDYDGDFDTGGFDDGGSDVA